MASVTTSDSAKEHEEGTKKAKKNHNNRKDFTDTGQDQNTLGKKKKRLLGVAPSKDPLIFFVLVIYYFSRWLWLWLLLLLLFLFRQFPQANGSALTS